MEGSKILELKGITKKFGGVVALDNVDFELYENEILALVGDNGAGKSTLIKIISGIYQADGGEIFLDGNNVEIKNPTDSIELGIETIYQELALFDNLSASANIYAGRELIFSGAGRLVGLLDQRRMEEDTRILLNNLNISLPNIKEDVEKLSGGQRQSVAISRAIKWGRKIIIMDEPAAALGVKESMMLLDLIRSLIGKVRGVIIISHNIEHVLGVAHRVIVLRRGKRVGDIQVLGCKDPEILHTNLVMMITGIKTNSKEA
jgi:ABC-type sugar transport system ATPase subunit